MLEHFNGLSPEVAELLAILAEECGEVTQCVGKILRHGIRSNPYVTDWRDRGKLNTAFLEDELADLFTIVALLERLGVIDDERIQSLIEPKLEKLRRPDILHHSTLLHPKPCFRCGSTSRIQRGFGDDGLVECALEPPCLVDEQRRNKVI